MVRKELFEKPGKLFARVRATPAIMATNRSYIAYSCQPPDR